MQAHRNIFDAYGLNATYQANVALKGMRKIRSHKVGDPFLENGVVRTGVEQAVKELRPRGA